jgi:hypothetical protein
VTPPDALETLRRVNENLRSALLRFRPERKHCSIIKSQDFSDIRVQLTRAAQCLPRGTAPRNAAATIEAALEKEALEYRNNLEKLKRFLPDVHLRLLAEKTRIATARTHIKSAAAWNRAAQKTP